MPNSEYLWRIVELMGAIEADQGEALDRAAEAVYRCIRRDGLVFAFGCGHSHLIAEDMFYRAGGLVPVSAMLDSCVMLHEGAFKSSMMERTEGIARHIFDRYAPTPNDILLISSTSGINAVPVEMALAARERGVFTIGLVSSAYEAEPSRHGEGLRLSRVVDLAIDDHVPYGDAVVRVAPGAVHAGPVSTILNSFVANSIVVRAAKLLSTDGGDPKVFLSGNIEGGEAHNAGYLEAYRNRIKLL